MQYRLGWHMTCHSRTYPTLNQALKHMGQANSSSFDSVSNKLDCGKSCAEPN